MRHFESTFDNETFQFMCIVFSLNQSGLYDIPNLAWIKCTRYSLDKMNLRLPLSRRCDERHILGGPPTYPLCDTNSHHLRDRDRYLVKKVGGML